MSDDSANSENGWRRYHQVTAGRPPRPTLLRALDAFAAAGPAAPPRHAVDLGCGIGRDTAEILRRGWSALVIDVDQEALDRLSAELAPTGGARLTMRRERIEVTRLPACDLVNASFVLPFLSAADFTDLWARIGASLRPSGRFAGHLFGPEDEWVKSGRCFGLTRQELDALLADWAVEWLDEERSDAVTPRGTAKHWHIWHVAARRAELPTAETGL